MQKEVTRLLKSNNILLEIKYFLMRLLILLFILISLNGCATGRYDKAVVTKIESSSYRIAFKALNDSMSKLENYINQCSDNQIIPYFYKYKNNIYIKGIYRFGTKRL